MLMAGVGRDEEFGPVGFAGLDLGADILGEFPDRLSGAVSEADEVKFEAVGRVV